VVVPSGYYAGILPLGRCKYAETAPVGAAVCNGRSEVQLCLIVMVVVLIDIGRSAYVRG
jgi:hypothetical protein